MPAEQALERHRKLVAEGWTRRFTAEEPRLSEMKELYESLGLEVLLTTAILEETQDCGGCFDTPEFENRYKTIYTRAKADSRRDPAVDVFE